MVGSNDCRPPLTLAVIPAIYALVKQLSACSAARKTGTKELDKMPEKLRRWSHALPMSPRFHGPGSGLAVPSRPQPDAGTGAGQGAVRKRRRHGIDLMATKKGKRKGQEGRRCCITSTSPRTTAMPPSSWRRKNGVVAHHWFGDSSARSRGDAGRRGAHHAYVRAEQVGIRVDGYVDADVHVISGQLADRGARDHTEDRLKGTCGGGERSSGRGSGHA